MISPGTGVSKQGTSGGRGASYVQVASKPASRLTKRDQLSKQTHDQLSKQTHDQISKQTHDQISEQTSE